LFFSVIMVTSVFAGAVALSGAGAAEAPGNAGSFAPGSFNPDGAPGGFGDNTQEATTTNGLTVAVAEINWSAPGNVTTVDVDLTEGANANGINASEIEEINVELYDQNGDLLAERREVPYNSNLTSVDFTGTAAENGDQVGAMRVTAKVNGAQDGDVIDAGVEVFDDNDGTSFGGTSPYDTRNNQTVSVAGDGTSPASISAFVQSQTQGQVSNATVFIIDEDTGTIVNPNDPLTTNNQGNTKTALGVPFGNYSALATKGGFSSERSSVTTLDANQTFDQVNVILEAIADPERIILEPRGEPEAPADGETTIVYNATVIGDFGDREDVPLEGIDVDLSLDDGQDVEGAAAFGGSGFSFLNGGPLGNTINTTDENGVALFEVRSDVIQTATLNASVRLNQSISDTAPARFGVLAGEGQVPGQVFASDTTSGLPNATVWAVTSDRYRGNTIHALVDLDTYEDGGEGANETVFVRVVDQDTNRVLDNDEYEVEVGPARANISSYDGFAFPPGRNAPKANEIALASDIELESGVSVAELLAGSGEVDEDLGDLQFEWAQNHSVGKVDRLNTSNASLGEGFFARDDNGDNVTAFFVTPVERGNYTVQVAGTLTNASRQADAGTGVDDDDFVNHTGAFTGNTLIRTPENLTSARAENTTDRQDGPILIDETDEDGDYLLDLLYTDFQRGQRYTVIAEKAGYDRDWADVFVREDGYRYEDQEDEVLVLEPEPITPVVNVTQWALLPNRSVVDPANASDLSSYDAYEFGNQSDAFAQRVPRDGVSVDVLVVNTTAERDSSIPTNATVRLEVPDDDPGFAPDRDEENFTVDDWVVAGGTIVEEGEDNVTLYTGSDGTAVVWMISQQSNFDLLTSFNDRREECVRDEFSELDPYWDSLVATVTTNLREDVTCKDFVGTIRLQSASVSGIVTDRANQRVPESLVYVNEFEFGTRLGLDIEPAPGAPAKGSPTFADYVTNPTSNFTITLYDPTTNAPIRTVVVNQSTLDNFQFSDFRRLFPTLVIAPNVVNNPEFTGFDLLDETTDRADYTLDPVPAAEGLDTSYVVEGIKLRPGRPGDEANDGITSVIPNTTGTANVVFPFIVVGANFQITGLNAPPNVTQGNQLTVQANVENQGGNRSATQEVEFRVDLDGDNVLESDEVIASQNVTLGAGGSDIVTFTIDGSVTGSLDERDYRHGVFTENDEAIATITVESAGFSVSDYDTNGQSGIQTGELSNAVDDWASGDISAAQLSQVVNAWASS